jgi:formate dehydrogenase subunit gamma
MELSHVIHVGGAVILIAVSIGHMYLGSVGSEGSLEGMKTGYVDISWVEAHQKILLMGRCGIFPLLFLVSVWSGS